ncbi:hypothetical protein [Alteromonas macleodii]|uniref:Uncharacterized protein n=1 Tax=Alteromonas macleodii TaxID=28108 RepID=A0AB36FRW3_ALTMA|nr:hypothetical protein [Alteromonas macleodii]OES32077.1 hypothetical protein BFV95_2170 [Alteromonas macleodii]OES32112.1 hypothetical protein BFV94_2168 [Alteromonas macleodii]OES32322.1 hypothetical protein BFV93_2162 [Alteromonas macleodii]OES41332.1 hypothetical protein BFV96_2157 [Alteromonas macleodii]
MNSQKKAAPKGSSNVINTRTVNSQSTEMRPPYKIELALNALLNKGPQGITQPEAFNAYRESCLHTTISSLKNERGIGFVAEPDFETVVHFYQKPFNRYWLATDEDRVMALKLLNAYRSNRGLPKVHFEAWHKPDNKAA